MSSVVNEASPTAETFSSVTYDYLVVGGGTAGLVVAARLSENQSINVGILEAGPAAFQEPLIDVPGRLGESLGSKYDWKYETTSQPGIGGRKLAWPRGKVLGGTSALNFMTWNRGCKEDYDSWEELGNLGWGWDSLLPYFKKSEKFSAPSRSHQEKHSSFFNPVSHGLDGPMKSGYPDEFSPCHPYWHSTLNRLGVETNKNHFAGSNVGVWTSLATVDPIEKTRCYSATAYLRPAMARPNLSVLTEAMVREVVIESYGGALIATGVRLDHGGKEYVVKAGEVILSAGSVSSPQLLELSGIGNPDILKAAGITVKVSNPNVGENLQEHMMTMTIYELDPSIITPEDRRSDPNLAAAAEESYKASKSGPLTMVPSDIAYTSVSHFLSPNGVSELVSKMPPPTSRRSKILSRQFSPTSNLGQVEFNFDATNYSPHFESEPGKKYATMMMMLQYPFSVGSIHIPASASPQTNPTSSDDKPVIDPQYYASEGGDIDLAVMIAAQKFAHKICRSAPLSSIVHRRVFPPEPESKTGRYEVEDEDFTSYVQNYTITDWHPVGTCGMGGSEGRNSGVVDERLRVYGVQSLRVCDASIMPLQISAHIQATVYAIAEKGATMILEDRKKNQR